MAHRDQFVWRLSVCPSVCVSFCSFITLSWYYLHFGSCFIFALLTLLPDGKFKKGRIELYIKDYIQNWANQSHISLGQK